MSIISYIKEQEISSFPERLTKVRVLNTEEDVATLAQTFMVAKEAVGYKNFSYVVESEDGYYFMVYVEHTGEFDLFDFINRSYGTSVSVNALNIKMLFPESKSRGIYDTEESTGEIEDEAEPTSFMDESDLYEVESSFYLVSNTRDIRMKVPVDGLVIGRTANKVDLLLRDNVNIGRVHCKLYLNNNHLMVHDFESRNGTFVNSQRVHVGTDVELHRGDTLTLANEDFIIR